MYRLRNIKSSIIILQFTIKKKNFSVIHGGVHTNLKLLYKKKIFANNLTFFKIKKKNKKKQIIEHYIHIIFLSL